VGVEFKERQRNDGTALGEDQGKNKEIDDSTGRNMMEEQRGS
jgi:hypothetical protein